MFESDLTASVDSQQSLLTLSALPFTVPSFGVIHVRSVLRRPTANMGARMQGGANVPFPRKRNIWVRTKRTKIVAIRYVSQAQNRCMRLLPELFPGPRGACSATPVVSCQEPSGYRQDHNNKDGFQPIHVVDRASCVLKLLSSLYFVLYFSVSFSVLRHYRRVATKE